MQAKAEPKALKLKLSSAGLLLAWFLLRSSDSALLLGFLQEPACSLPDGASSGRCYACLGVLSQVLLNQG